MMLKEQKRMADARKLEEQSTKEKRAVEKDKSRVVGSLLRQKAKQMTLIAQKKSRAEKHKLSLSKDKVSGISNSPRKSKR